MSKRLVTEGKGKLAFFVLLPIVFFLIPTSWLEKHPPPCLSRILFGVRCPGCGMSRAMSCAIHGNFKKALHYNKLVVVVLPLLVYEWWREIQHQMNHALHEKENLAGVNLIMKWLAWAHQEIL